jgi:hypothetical protein
MLTTHDPSIIAGNNDPSIIQQMLDPSIIQQVLDPRISPIISNPSNTHLHSHQHSVDTIINPETSPQTHDTILLQATHTARSKPPNSFRHQYHNFNDTANYRAYKQHKGIVGHIYLHNISQTYKAAH